MTTQKAKGMTEWLLDERSSPNPGLKVWAMVFYRFAVILSAPLASIPSLAAPPPAVSETAPIEATTIEPGSVISGYPVTPTFTLSRYDEDYSYLANPANRTEPLDLIKYIPLFDWGPLYFVSLGGDIREQYEFIENDNFGLGSVKQPWLLAAASDVAQRLAFRPSFSRLRPIQIVRGRGTIAWAASGDRSKTARL